MSFHPLAARLVEWVLRRFGLVYGAQGYRARTLKRLDLALILDRALSFSLSLSGWILYCIVSPVLAPCELIVEIQPNGSRA